MAKYWAKDLKVMVNAVNLSYWAFKVDAKLEKDQLEVSGFNVLGAKEFIPGQADEEFIIGFRQDFATNAVDDTLGPLYVSGSLFPISVAATSDAGARQYSGSAGLYEYHPFDAEFGGVSETTVTFKLNGGVTRGTS